MCSGLGAFSSCFSDVHINVPLMLKMHESISLPDVSVICQFCSVLLDNTCLVFQPSQIPLDENILVSRYISKPLLIDGESITQTPADSA